MNEARQGRRWVLLTIDPAQRLADAYTSKWQETSPQRSLPEECAGHLWAMMLDAGGALRTSVVNTHPYTRGQIPNRYFSVRQRQDGVFKR